jgi:phage tail sheath protein FI
MDYRTPGVFVEELTLLPPSVAGVATAIPAFVGHTANTSDSEGASLLNIPIRITSFPEFTSIFGGSYDPASYKVQAALGTGATFTILGVTPVNGRRYYLHEALRHYFDNGGGPCYVVSVGDHSAPVAYGSVTRVSGADCGPWSAWTSPPSSSCLTPWP